MKGLRSMGKDEPGSKTAEMAATYWRSFTNNFEGAVPVDCEDPRLHLVGCTGVLKEATDRVPEDLCMDPAEAVRKTIEHTWAVLGRPEGHVLFVRRPLELKWYLEADSPTDLWWATTRVFSVPAAEAKWVQDEIAERVARRVANGGPA